MLPRLATSNRHALGLAVTVGLICVAVPRVAHATDVSADAVLNAPARLADAPLRLVGHATVDSQQRLRDVDLQVTARRDTADRLSGSVRLKVPGLGTFASERLQSLDRTQGSAFAAYEGTIIGHGRWLLVVMIVDDQHDFVKMILQSHSENNQIERYGRVKTGDFRLSGPEGWRTSLSR